MKLKPLSEFGIKAPSWCCQECGASIGWLGRLLNFLLPFPPFRHRCPVDDSDAFSEWLDHLDDSDSEYQDEVPVLRDAVLNEEVLKARKDPLP